MRLVGYARVSTGDQDTRMQLDALRKAGVDELESEACSGIGPRPVLRRVLAGLGRGDVLVVWKIDRIARGLPDLLRIVEALKTQGAGVRSLTEPMDTSVPLGEFVIQMLGAVAQLERSMIRERAIAGQVAALRRGVRWGGSVARLSHDDRQEIVRCWESGWWTQQQLADAFDISLSTVKRALGRMPNTLPRARFPVLGQYLEQTFD